MSFLAVYYAQCDRCDVQDFSGPYTTKDRAAIAAQEGGWMRRGESTLLCPSCTCMRCFGTGQVPDYKNSNAYYGEPKPIPCPRCNKDGSYKWWEHL